MSASTYWNHVLEQFVRYFARHAPGLPDAIKGTPPDRIDALEALAGQPFPPEYRAFLLAMGDTPPGTLDPFLAHIRFGPGAVEALYREPGVHPPRDAVYLWTYDYDTPYDHFIDTLGGEHDTRGLLQAAWHVDEETNALVGEPVLQPLGGSLMRSLCIDAFLHLRDPLLPESLELRDRGKADRSEAAQAKLIERLRAAAGQLGFTAVPFVDGDRLFLDRADASLKLYAQSGANVIYVRAADEREVSRIGEVLADNLNLVIWR